MNLNLAQNLKATHEHYIRGNMETMPSKDLNQQKKCPVTDKNIECLNIKNESAMLSWSFIHSLEVKNESIIKTKNNHVPQ